MLRSLFSGVSGVSAHQTKMDVIGNNIANVNTYGFKASTTQFSNMFYQNLADATGGSATAGGTNPSQVGYGTTVGIVKSNMSRAGFQTTSSTLDLAIAGEGFFQVQDASGNIFYTRAGSLNIDDYGNLIDSKGNFVLGVTGVPEGQAPASTKIQISVPSVEDQAAFAEKTLFNSVVRFEASNIGKEGNLNINFVHSEDPSAELVGENLTVYFDQKAAYETLDDLQAAIDQAIALSGLELPTGQIRISVDPVPPESSAAAYSTLTLPEKSILSFGADTSTSDLATGVRVSIISGTEGITWDDTTNTYALSLDSTKNYNQADIDAILATIADPTAPAITTNFTGADVSASQLIGKGFVIPGGNASATESLEVNNINTIEVTYTSQEEGKDGNAIEVQYRTIAAGGTPSAQWNGNTLIFSLVEGAYYDQSTLETLMNTANGKAGIIAGDGDFRNLTISPFTNLVKAEDFKDVKLGRGDGTFAENIAGQLGNVKLADGRVSAEQTHGNLTGITISNDGVIMGTHAVHGIMIFGRVDIATFDNPNGLEALGDNYFGETVASGEARLTVAGENGSGELVSSALEMSNVDLAQEFADMITTQRGFQANSRMITTSDEILQELVNLKR